MVTTVAFENLHHSTSSAEHAFTEQIRLIDSSIAVTWKHINMRSGGRVKWTEIDRKVEV